MTVNEQVAIDHGLKKNEYVEICKLLKRIPNITELGNINEENNPNGSIKNIAGIFNKEKNVLGMMPHPERMIDPALSGEDGSIFFENLINNLK